jgi:hypothetical protein
LELKVDHAEHIYIYEALMVVTIKIIIFWDMTQCSLVGIYWYFRGMCCLYLQGARVRKSLLPWRWRVCTFLWNNGNHILDYMVSHARRQSSFTTRPWTQQMW